MYRGVIERYRAFLPVSENTPIITLNEGDTPLIPAPRLAATISPLLTLYCKYEGLNPTGSFKDRGMTMAVTRAAEEGQHTVMCASTGNTSASAAAYAARAGLAAFVLIPEGRIAMGKLAQAMLHGSVVLQIKGNFDAGMALVKQVAREAPVTIVNSINPFRLQGQKTAAFEIIEALGRAPDYHCLPVGNAGNITAHWMGYREYFDLGIAKSRPRMCGYQASGAAPFLRGRMVDNPETVATAIRIGHPQSWTRAWEVQKESDGWFDELSDGEILAAQKLLAAREGVFCEPASAASLAGALRDIRRGKIPAGSTVVCTLTGHGLKDPDIAIKQSEGRVSLIEARLDDVKRAILQHLK